MKRLNHDRPILAWVKSLCDYGIDNCDPVCLNVKCEKSKVLPLISLPSQQAHEKPFEKSKKALISIDEDIDISNMSVQYQSSSIIAMIVS